MSVSRQREQHKLCEFFFFFNIGLSHFSLKSYKCVSCHVTVNTSEVMRTPLNWACSHHCSIIIHHLSAVVDKANYWASHQPWLGDRKDANSKERFLPSFFPEKLSPHFYTTKNSMNWIPVLLFYLFFLNRGLLSQIDFLLISSILVANVGS